jgi:S1 RNA binding domain/Zc3h12a-like Ribonuclease NYN domain
MPQHVIVDGSNLATEGRSLPSLAQLNDAVMAYMAEHPDHLITVVVDATFGHRIDAKEVAEFDDAVANNELVAPPAGAVGRGDAFVLSIANKVGGTILSNDSFQEFHGQYEWLFDGDRLIGGKPVPHIGWVFVQRVPVRGMISRNAVKDAKRKKGGGDERGRVRQGSPEASKPMPVPKAPPPGARKAAPKASPKDQMAAAVAVAAEPAPTKSAVVNDLMPFLSFVEHHPVGTSVNAVVENYSSHGAYVRVGDVKAYVPLRLMAEPAPRSAREFMKIGDAVTLVVDSFAPARRSIDLAVVGMSTATPPAPPKKAAPRKAAAAKAEPKKGEPKKGEPKKAEPKKAEPKKGDAKKAVAKNAESKKADARKPDAKKSDAKQSDAKKPDAKKPEPKTAGVTKAASAKPAATNAVAPPAKKSVAKLVEPVASADVAPPQERPKKRASRPAPATIVTPAAPVAPAPPARRATKKSAAAPKAAAPEVAAPTAPDATESAPTPVRRRRVH